MLSISRRRSGEISLLACSSLNSTILRTCSRSFAGAAGSTASAASALSASRACRAASDLKASLSIVTMSPRRAARSAHDVPRHSDDSRDRWRASNFRNEGPCWRIWRGGGCPSLTDRSSRRPQPRTHDPGLGCYLCGRGIVTTCPWRRRASCACSSAVVSHFAPRPYVAAAPEVPSTLALAWRAGASADFPSPLVSLPARPGAPRTA
jgi:hypothetical protein